MEAATQPPRLVPVATGVRLNMSETGAGEPLLLIGGTGGSLGLWTPLIAPLAERHRVIAFDNRGLGDSERGDGRITTASMAADTAALLDALDIERAHVVGWSLGSAVAQELALAHPGRLGALVLYATWGRIDAFTQAMIAALLDPRDTGDLAVAMASPGLAFTPRLRNAPRFGPMFEQLLPFFPQTESQVRATVEQLHADVEHDALDRLGAIRAPTLVIAGQQDVLTPAWRGRAVADRIPGARYALFTGPGSSHGLATERPEEFLRLVLGFVAEHPLPGAAGAAGAAGTG